MGRKKKYSDAELVAAARELVVEAGPDAATVAAIAERVGAPVGSVYHRFRSRGVILATVLLDEVATFQAAFAEAATKASPGELAAHVVAWVRAHPAGARLLALYRRDELLGAGIPGELLSRATELQAELEAGIRELARRWLGTARAEARGAVRLAIAELPLGAVRPLLARGERVPRSHESLVAAAADAVIEAAREEIES